MKRTNPLLFNAGNEQPHDDAISYHYKFTHLFNCYRGELHHTALKITQSKSVAEDVVHDVFMKLWLKRTEILTISVAELRPYLHTMTRNRVLDNIRKNKRENLAIQRMGHKYSNFYMLHDRCTANLYDQTLHKVVQQMPAKQQQAYRFVKELGLSYKATAETMRISNLTVKKHIANAMKSIQTYFKKNAMAPY